LAKSAASTTLCVNQTFTFNLTSNNGGSADPAEWPAGTLQGTQSGSCFVRINQPGGNLDTTIGTAFSIVAFAGFNSTRANPSP
jgi:hypothetical protein